MEKQIMVSICCITYNHKNYISQALDSFIKQKTSFDFEIVVHDDCSTDGTIEILKEYQKKYPSKIKIIIPEKNLYSQNIKIEPIIFNQCVGKYIALCDGDDYWCDEQKLQKQFNYMEENINTSLLFHDAKLYMENTQKFKKRKTNIKSSRFINMSELILGTGIGGSFPTCSMFFKKADVEVLPDFFIKSEVGDMPLGLYLGLKGNVFYMSDIMGVYRCNVPGSWTIRIKKRSDDEVIKSQNNFDDMMRAFNKYSNYKYNDEVELYILRNEFELNNYFKDSKSLKNKKFKKLYSIATFKGKIRYFILRNFYQIFLILKRIKNGQL